MTALVHATRSRHRRREVTVTVVLAVVVSVIGAASLAVGAYSVALPDLLATLFGGGDAGDRFIIFELRMPRVAIGVLVGVGFALAGAILQSLLSNPLASPDLIGITGGASAAAVTALLIFEASGFIVSLSAFGGAIVVAAAISVLSIRSGLSGYRFVLIGIGFAFMVQAVLGYLLTRADLQDAQSALVWLVGSLGSTTWAEISVTAVCLLVLAPCLAVLAPRLRVLQLGDDTATGLGVRVGVARILLIALAVAFAAVATAAAGPVAFVAFLAAPIARRMVGAGRLSLIASALTGVVIVLASDFIGQHAVPGGLQVPVGIITGIIGAPYLIWLLARSNRTT